MSEKNQMTYVSDAKIHFMTLFDSGVKPLPSLFKTKLEFKNLSIFKLRKEAV